MRLAEALRSRGHDLWWMAKGKTALRLKNRGHYLSHRESISAPLFREDQPFAEARYNALLAETVALRQEIEEEQPDLCLIDRNLGVATMVLTTLGIPFVCVGTPGGYWGRGPEGVKSLASPSQVYQHFGEQLCQRLPWLHAELTSWWQPSPHLNVVFVGRTFYPMADGLHRTAFVNMFNEAAQRTGRERIGITFGHSGKVERLLSFFQALEVGEWFPVDKVDVFIGGRPELSETLSVTAPHYRLHGWTPYHKAFSQLSCVICFGGIGTLWHCINHCIPSLVIPGGAGDQQFNAERMQALGLGRLWNGPTEDSDSLRQVFASTLQTDGQTAFQRFRARENFTDNLESLLPKLESLGRS